jgi:adenosylcobinamide amidohydrolase
VAADLGADDCPVALMTAVPLKQLVVLREAAAGLWVEGFFTVGVTNAVRAGEPVSPARSRRRAPGTINMILVTNAVLPAPAMVCMIQVATESKTAVLMSERVPSWTGKPGATGTGTDAVVVTSGAEEDGPVLKYSGTHTKLGELVGRLVNRGVQQGLAKSRRWSRRRTD